ncbi:MAG: hypothetical protein IJZ85_02915 [Lachnospiraceae bacterium]|nr:hypothetical protein [Lachnospiraceae bacterium]
MNKMFKRVMAFLLALTMVLSLAACGTPADTETDAPGTDAPADNQTEAPAGDQTEAPADEEFDPRKICEGVTLTIAVPEDDEVSTWDENLMTKMIYDELGVTLKFQAYPADDFGDKLNVMVNGGDELPDMIWGAATVGLNSYYKQWVAAEAILPLNEFYENDNYTTYFRAASEKCGVDLTALMKDADGIIWYMPKYFQYQNGEVRFVLWINEEYAAKVGFDELPTTAEGFYELCKAFKEAGDVNGNGLDDEVALVGYNYPNNIADMAWFKLLMSAYAYAWDDYYLDVENGELSFAYTSDEWKEGLKYIKKFFDEGIVDTTILTNDRTAYKAIVNNPEMPNLMDLDYYPQISLSSNYESAKARLKFGYVNGLSSEYKEAESCYFPINTNCGAVITADCENPDAAFLVMDYMCSEKMGLMNRYGVEGVNWDYWDNLQEELIPAPYTKDSLKGRWPEDYPQPYFVCYNDAAFWGTGEPRDTSYMQVGPGIHPEIIFWGVSQYYDYTTEEMATVAEWNYKHANSTKSGLKMTPAESVFRLPMTVKEITDAGEIQSTLDSYVRESIGAFLTGEWDIDAYWDTYLAELDKIGIDEALEIYQTSYDRTK